jgi:SAM-dependent methyltransferase
MIGGWLKQAIDEGHEISAMGADIGLYNFIAWGNQVDCNENLPQIWEENFPKNVEYWDAHPDKIIGSAMDMPKHEGKCVIFVGNGPSLMKAIDMFPKGDDRDKFVICCANSALETLLKHDVVPDYVILVDGRTGHWTMDIHDDRCKDIVALFSPAATPEAVSTWRGKCYVIPYKLSDENTTKKIQERWGYEYPISGGNGLNCAIGVFVRYCHALTYILVGNELSWVDKYYADGREHNINTADAIRTRNIYGEMVKTSIGHYEYKLWLDSFIKSLHPEFYFINCSEGIVGVESDGTVWPHLNHKPLDMAVEDVLNAFDFENKGEMEKIKEMYELLYASGEYGDFNGATDEDGDSHGGYRALPNYLDPNSPHAWHPFESILDVGCGKGEGVKLLGEEGYEAWGCDIADLSNIWTENGIENRCWTAPSHDLPFNNDSFDMVMCCDVLEHIPPDYVDKSLDEIFRVSRKYFYFSIACCEETPVRGKYNIPLHMTIMPPNWWMEKLTVRGLTPIYHSIAEDETYFFVYGEKS